MIHLIFYTILVAYIAYKVGFNNGESETINRLKKVRIRKD